MSRGPKKGLIDNFKKEREESKRQKQANRVQIREKPEMSNDPPSGRFKAFFGGKACEQVYADNGADGNIIGDHTPRRPKTPGIELEFEKLTRRRGFQYVGPHIQRRGCKVGLRWSSFN